MPDISKINALDITNVSKVDGLAKASILDIDGVAVPSAFTGLLDETYGSGASVAYSTRRLASATTVLMRVRRDTSLTTGDDDEADVAYDSNNELSLDSAISNASAGVTATTLGEFINVGTVGGTTYSNPDSLTVTASCFVDEWKDQSGNAIHATQGTFTRQPLIHSGTGNTDLITENGKPAVSFDGGGDSFNFDLTTSIQSGGYWHAFHVMQSSDSMAILMNSQTDPAIYYCISQSSTSTSLSGGFVSTSGTNNYLDYYKNGTQPLTSGDTRADITSNFYTGSQLLMNFMATTSSGSNVTDMRLCRYADPGGFEYMGTLQEVIIYQSDQSSNRTSIETNINGFFSIYP